ncbi:hypothetical protein Hamer_G025029 [Homarus americanus]|uniref:Uncharacterized protein n=1 Tax=Homarus americanus TaxID=6706 RepID=A0A8J5N6Q8_HOMAM|nr:hypothetical protein Hamer_G025029 [Homarus americanus]
MNRFMWFFLVGVLLPLATSLVTYTFISMGSNALAVDETGALIIILTLIKLVLLSTQGIFPININKVFNNIIERGKRSPGSSSRNTNIIGSFDNSTLYQVPEVDVMPCIRRFLCELEVAARTSDNYLPKEPEVVMDRNLEEEVAPEEVDPISEMQDPMGDLSPRGLRALAVMEGLTGPSCELAYRLCPGRYTAPLAYRAIFEEINLIVHDYD